MPNEKRFKVSGEKRKFAFAVQTRCQQVVGHLAKRGIHVTDLPTDVKRALKKCSPMWIRLRRQKNWWTTDEEKALQDLATWAIHQHHETRGTAVPKTAWTP